MNILMEIQTRLMESNRIFLLNLRYKANILFHPTRKHKPRSNPLAITNNNKKNNIKTNNNTKINSNSISNSNSKSNNNSKNKNKRKNNTSLKDLQTTAADAKNSTTNSSNPHLATCLYP